MRKILLSFLLLLIIATASCAYLMFEDRTIPDNYKINIKTGMGLSALSVQLQEDNIISNRYIFLLAARIMEVKQLNKGSYSLKSHQISMWEILKKLQDLPDTVSVRLIEGKTFKQWKKIVAEITEVELLDNMLSENEILTLLEAPSEYTKIEGLLFPDTYEFVAGIKEIEIYRHAYKNMENKLASVWAERDAGLPYKNPYELLIMASIIEKETGIDEDRKKVASVFINRLKLNMRLQTDPTVIYGMGDAYKGKIRKKDLKTDTPYNTYTRVGLPPSPIAMPSLLSLNAAAHPDMTDYLYFVSRMDGSGRSHFSKDLNEHNKAVWQYILKRK